MIKLCTIHRAPTMSHQIRKVGAAFKTDKLWVEKSQIRITFVDEPDKIQRTSISELKARNDADLIDPLQDIVESMPIKDAIKLIVRERIEAVANLTFEFIDDPKKAHIRISFNPADGCWSEIGTDCMATIGTNTPTLNFGWFDVATTIHEFGHVLGMIHEHQNERDGGIKWNEEAVYEWARKTQGWTRQLTYDNIINKYKKDSTNGGTFDPMSIMLYFFPASLTTDGRGTKENLRLSPFDVLYISSIYPGRDVAAFYQRAYGVPLDTTRPPNFARPVELYTPPPVNKTNIGTAAIDAILITALIIFCSFLVVKFLMPK